MSEQEQLNDMMTSKRFSERALKLMNDAENFRSRITTLGIVFVMVMSFFTGCQVQRTLSGGLTVNINTGSEK